MQSDADIPESYDVLMAEMWARYPEEAELQEQRLADPDWCASCPDLAAAYTNTAKLRRFLDWQRELENPFSELSLKMRRYTQVYTILEDGTRVSEDELN